MYIDVATQAAIPYSQKIIGQLAVNDTIDYYKLEMPFDGTVKFSLLANMREVKMTIRNSQDEVLDFAYFKENGLNYSCALKKGTYYLCFTQVYGTGTYWFTASSEIKTPVNVAVNASSATSVKVTATKSGEISGYEIRYKKGSGSWKNIVKTGNKNLNTNITDLAPGTYNVQVRTYCVVSGKTYHSQWSNTVSVKIKK